MLNVDKKKKGKLMKRRISLEKQLQKTQKRVEEFKKILNNNINQ